MSKIVLVMFFTALSSIFLSDGWQNPGVAQGTAIADCAGCHGNPPSDAARIAGLSGTFLGSHNKHAGSSPVQYGQACTVCHYNNGTYPTGNKHSNGYINITGSKVRGNSYSLGRSKQISHNPTFGTCSNVTCHATGRVDKVQNVTSLTWGSATNCLACHGGRVSASGNFATGSVQGFKLSTTHTQHLKYSATALPFMNCNICHSKTASDAATLKSYTGVIYHANGTANVRFTGLVYASITSYKANKTCANTSCHGGITRNAWSTTTINNDNTCVHCHGTAGTPPGETNIKKFAPGWAGIGIDTDGNNAAGGARVGAHFAHLSSIYMKKLKCAECHQVPTSPFDSVNAPSHMEAKRYNSAGLNFVQASSAKLYYIANTTRATLPVFGGYTSGYNTKAATCSSVYCHGNRMKWGDTSGNYRNPGWAMTSYTVAAPATDCGRCHGNPPSAGLKASTHTGVGTAQTGGCSGCHNNVTLTGGFKDKSLHINGFVEGGGACNGCHDYDVSVFNTWTGSHKDYGGFAQGVGVHAKHITYLKNRFGVTLVPATDAFGTGNPAKVCGVCHTNDIANHTTGTPANPRSIVFSSYTAHHHDAAGAVTYNGTSGTSGGKTCSNIDCHYKTTPLWY